MQDGVRSCGRLLEFLNRLLRRQDHEFDFAARSFFLHLFHDRQSSCAGPDHQALALPGYLLLDGNWRVSEGFTELFGRLLLALADFTAIDHHVVLVGGPVNADRTE